MMQLQSGRVVRSVVLTLLDGCEDAGHLLNMMDVLTGQRVSRPQPHARTHDGCYRRSCSRP